MALVLYILAHLAQCCALAHLAQCCALAHLAQCCALAQLAQCGTPESNPDSVLTAVLCLPVM